MQRIAVLDFETTGLSPAHGDRATEVAIVVLEGDCVVTRFHSLMNAGVHLSSFIEDYTGITNDMVRSAPPASRVMKEAAQVVGDLPLVAHNASFDQKFWSAELMRLSTRESARAANPFACTMLLSRRVYPGIGSYRLGSLAAYHSIPSAGRSHRALADAEVAAALFSRIKRDIRTKYGTGDAPHDLLMKVQRTPRGLVERTVRNYFAN